jgi:hypothetical protein
MTESIQQPEQPPAPRLSDAARAEFDRAVARGVDSLFNLPGADAAAMMSEFLDGRLILVISRDGMWARTLVAADDGPDDGPAEIPTPRHVAADEGPDDDSDAPSTGMYL